MEGDALATGPWQKYGAQRTRKYRVTSPDGKAFEVTAPEGATEAEVMAYAQQNFRQAAPQASQGPWNKYQAQPFDKGAEPADKIEVEMPDGTILEFPGNTAPEVMQRVSAEYHSTSAGPAAEPNAGRNGAKPWADVANSAAYRALPSHEQEAARSQYFRDVVAPQLPSEQERQSARAQFDAQTGPSDYTEDELFPRLERADAAGDTEAAKVIADEIRRIRAYGTRTKLSEVTGQQRPRKLSEVTGAVPPPPPGFELEDGTPPLPPGFELENDPNSSDFARMVSGRKPAQLEASLRGVLNGDLQSGVRQGLKQAALGTGQLALQGGPGGILARKFAQYLGAPAGHDPLADASSGLGALAQRSSEAFERTRAGQNYAGQGGRMVGQTAPAMLIPGGQSTLPARLGMAGIGGATAGAVQPVTDGDYASQKAAQVGTGGLLGLLGQFGLGEPARWASGRLAAAAAGGKANVSAAAQKALDYAKQHGLPIYADDVLASPTARGAGVFVDDVPGIGGAGRRRAQSEAAAEHARGVAARYPAQGANTAQTLVQSAEAQLQRARGIKNRLYADAFGKLNQAGDFALLNTRAEARKLIAAERTKGTLADTGLIAELGKYVDAPRFNFEGWHGVRSELGNLIRSKRTGENSVLSDRAGFVLSHLKARMDAELSQAAGRIGGNAASAWKAADKFYREAMPKYRHGTVAAMLKSPDPDAIANRILGGRDSGNIARQVYGALDKQGRAEVRSAIVSRALERSMKQTDGGDAVFSPGQFAKELDSVSERSAVFFSKTDRAEMEGLRNYMGFIRNSGHYASNPQTGRRLITHAAIMGGSGAAGVAAPATYAGVTLTARALLRTESGRNLLLRMGSVSPQSKAAEQTAQLIASYLERQAASEKARSHNRGR